MKKATISFNVDNDFVPGKCFTTDEDGNVIPCCPLFVISPEQFDVYGNSEGEDKFCALEQITDKRCPIELHE